MVAALRKLQVHAAARLSLEEPGIAQLPEGLARPGIVVDLEHQVTAAFDQLDRCADTKVRAPERSQRKERITASDHHDAVGADGRG